MSKNQFVSVDALRGLATVTIAVFHFSASGWAGYLAVEFFCVLSGFVLAHSYLYSDKTLSPGEFICRRLARLYPMHVFSLICFTLAIYFFEGRIQNHGGNTFFSIIQQLTLTHNVGFSPWGLTWNYPAWSVSVEFWVNIIFIFFVLRSTRSIYLFLTAFVCLLVIYNNTGHLDTHFSNYYGFINSGIIRGIASFFIGIIGYRIYLKCADHILLRRYVTFIEFLCFMATLAVVMVRSGKSIGIEFISPFVFMAMIVVFALDAGFFSKAIARIKYLGTISYSIYMNHIVVVIAVNAIQWKYGFDRSWAFPVYLVVLVIYSSLTYRYVEEPLRIKGVALFKRLTCSTEPASLLPSATLELGIEQVDVRPGSGFAENGA